MRQYKDGLDYMRQHLEWRQQAHSKGECRQHPHHAIHRLTGDGWTRDPVPEGCNCEAEIAAIYVQMAKIRMGVK